MKLLGIQHSKFTHLPMTHSNDGVIMFVSDEAIKTLFKGLPVRREMSAKSGARTGQEGKSPIDNSVLRNVFTQHEHLEQKHIKNLQKITVSMYRCRQNTFLKKLNLTGQDPAAIKMKLESMDSTELKKLGITECNSFLLLKKTGRVIENWGQLPQEVKEENLKQAKALANEEYGKYKEAKIAKKQAELAKHSEPITLAEVTKQFEEEEKFWNRFVEFINKNTGRFLEPDDLTINRFLRDVKGGIYQDRKDTDLVTPGLREEYKKSIHHMLILCGMWSDKITVVPRREVEQESPHRFLPITWERKTDLRNVDEKGKETLLRNHGQKEVTAFRANEMPYMPSHGLGIPITSFHSELPGVDQLGYNVNLPLDEKACLENWYLIDVEKIVAEYKLLNPCLGKNDRMKGEVSLDVGQNPKAGSSVQYTQHSQVCAFSMKDYPIYQEKNNPQYSKALDAEIDIVQVGHEPDAFFVKIVTDDPTKPAIIEFVKKMQMDCLKAFGGPQKVDFMVKCINNDDGKCSLIFTPLAQLKTEEIGDSPISVTSNPFTGQKNIDSKVPMHCMDNGKCCGLLKMKTQQNNNDKKLTEIQAWANEGRPAMVRLYDYTRMPGSRVLIEGEVNAVVAPGKQFITKNEQKGKLSDNLS